jgi:hypothetical protein
MSEEQTLVPQTLREVNFYGDSLPIAVVNTEAFVALRPIVEYLGMSWGSQRLRLLRDEVLTRHSTTIRMTGADGRQREMLCLQLEFLPGWLFGVTPSRAKPELAPKLTRYREECFQVLWRAFQDELTQTQNLAPETATSLAQVRDLALAVAHMAEQQIEIEQRLNTRLDRAAAVVGNIQRRLNVVERRLSPPEYVTDEMATNIALAVKALAEAFSRRDPSKNHYQSVYVEIYRRFRAPSYDRVRIDKYEDVMKFLEDWQKSIDKQSQAGLFDESPER